MWISWVYLWIFFIIYFYSNAKQMKVENFYVIRKEEILGSTSYLYKWLDN